MSAMIFQIRHASNKKKSAHLPHLEGPFRDTLSNDKRHPNAGDHTTDETADKMFTRQRTTVQVFSENLRKAMAASIDRNTVAALAKAAGVGAGTVQRAKTGAVGLAIDTVEKIASALGYQAWQLLVPDFDPQNPPMLRALSPEERALYNKLKTLMPALPSAKR